MIVYTTLIMKEILIDREPSLERPIVIQLVLDPLYCHGMHDGPHLALILLPLLILAGAGCLASARVTLKGCEWIAGLRDHTSVSEVLPH